MAITVFYRGVDFIKNYVVRYLNSAFLANAKGALIFTDGVTNMEFSKTPMVIKSNSWTSRELPAVLVGTASGGFGYRTFSKDRLLDESFDDTGTARIVGGDIDLNIDLSIRATTIPERDRLVDTVCYLMSHPDAKDYFAQHGISLPSAPTIGGEYALGSPDSTDDFPIYATSVGLTLHSGWQSKETLETRLLDIIVDFSLMLDPQYYDN